MADVKVEAKYVQQEIVQPVIVEAVQITMSRKQAEALRSLLWRGTSNSLYEKHYQDFDAALDRLGVAVDQSIHFSRSAHDGVI